MDVNKAKLKQQTLENTQTIEHSLSGGKSLSDVFSQLQLKIISESNEEQRTFLSG